MVSHSVLKSIHAFLILKCSEKPFFPINVRTSIDINSASISRTIFVKYRSHLSTVCNVENN